MLLRSEIKVNPPADQINLKDPVLLTGSCFSENIGSLLSSCKFNVLVNPFGTLYNPHSIFRLMLSAAKENFELPETDIVFNQGIYRCLGFHSAISGKDMPDLKEKGREAFHRSSDFLRKNKWIILTLGTSIVYVYKKTGEIVANCHKLPADNFQRQFMQVDDIVAGFSELHAALNGINPEIKFILTVSPVRHLNEGFDDNQVSKSILRLACDRIARQFSGINYFPAYEIMIDDLRDYRFYSDDLVHPNSLAVQYIWEKFNAAYFDYETREFVRAWSKILKALSHRPFNPGSSEYKEFVKNTIEKLKSFGDKVNVGPEIEQLNDQL
ncbi:MAG TPA: GSCFA domain-containing protein [Cyclobacteriaceae bacterium]|nr:GSCFA domain-containing protein [Cyclobacteriaceae bacterium]